MYANRVSGQTSNLVRFRVQGTLLAQRPIAKITAISHVVPDQL